MQMSRMSLLALGAVGGLCFAAASAASAAPVYGPSMGEATKAAAVVENIAWRRYPYWGWGTSYGPVGDGYTDLGQPSWGSLYWYPPSRYWYGRY
jgi:hypothetical protein